MTMPPYIDPKTGRGSYDTDEQDAIEREVREAAKKWASLDADDDGRDLAAALIRQAYGAGYVRGVVERDDAA